MKDLGRFGIWRRWNEITPDQARIAESLGYGAIWLGASPKADLTAVEELIAATEAIPVVTGVVNMWREDPDLVPVGKDVAERDLLTDFVAGQVVDAELAERADLRQVRQLARDGLRQLALGAHVGAELDGGVAVTLGRAQAGHGIRFDGQDGHGHHRAVVLEHLGHADLSADQSNTHPVTS